MPRILGFFFLESSETYVNKKVNKIPPQYWFSFGCLEDPCSPLVLLLTALEQCHGHELLLVLSSVKTLAPATVANVQVFREIITFLGEEITFLGYFGKEITF